MSGGNSETEGVRERGVLKILMMELIFIIEKILSIIYYHPKNWVFNDNLLKGKFYSINLWVR